MEKGVWCCLVGVDAGCRVAPTGQPMVWTPSPDLAATCTCHRVSVALQLPIPWRAETPREETLTVAEAWCRWRAPPWQHQPDMPLPHPRAFWLMETTSYDDGFQGGDYLSSTFSRSFSRTSPIRGGC